MKSLEVDEIESYMPFTVSEQGSVSKIFSSRNPKGKFDSVHSVIPQKFGNVQL